MTDANTWNTTSTAKPATAGTPLLEVKGLHAGYGPVRVLHGLDLIVPEGQVAVILGDLQVDAVQDPHRPVPGVHILHLEQRGPVGRDVRRARRAPRVRVGHAGAPR